MQYFITYVSGVFSERKWTLVLMCTLGVKGTCQILQQGILILICCGILEVSWVPIAAISGSLSGHAGRNASLSFHSSSTMGLSCWSTIRVPSSLPSITQCDSAAAPHPCSVWRSGWHGGSCCSEALPHCWPHLNPMCRNCSKVSALGLQFLSPNPSFRKVRNTDTSPFPFQLMEGDRNSWPRLLWVDLTALQRCPSCTYRDISWLTLTACGIARSQEFAETEPDLNVHQNDFSFNRTIFGKHVALHKERSVHGPPSTWA